MKSASLIMVLAACGLTWSAVPGGISGPASGTAGLAAIREALQDGAVGHGPATGEDVFCNSCNPVCETRTLLVPVWETTWRNVVETRYRYETRQRVFSVTEKVCEQVPETLHFTEMVPRERSEPYTDYVQHEVQVPVSRQYTEMVPQQVQREATLFRTETWQEPVEQKYTVTVPRRRYRELKTMRIEYDRIPDVEQVVSYVPVQKTRPVIWHRPVEEVEKVRVPYTEMVAEERTAELVILEPVEAKRERKVPRVEYTEKTGTRTVTEYQYRSVPRPVTRNIGVLEYSDAKRQESIQYQDPERVDLTESFSVAEPYRVVRTETYTAQVPYMEEITETYRVTVSEPQQVQRTWIESVPYVEEVPVPCTVMLPRQETVTVPQTVQVRVPVTTFTTVCEDRGQWRDVQQSVVRCGEAGMGQGLAVCPVRETVCKRVWCPNPCQVQVPCTTWRIECRQINHSATVTRMVPETRHVLRPEVRYRREPRQISETVYVPRTEIRTRTIREPRFRAEQRTREVEAEKFRFVPQSRSTQTVQYRQKEFTYDVPYSVVGERTVSRTTDEMTTELVAVPREETYTYRVPSIIEDTVEEKYEILESRTVTQSYTVNVPRIRYREVERVTSRLQPETRTESYTEYVPKIENRMITRTVAREVPEIRSVEYTDLVTEERTRTVYETRTRQVPVKKTWSETVPVPQPRSRVEMETQLRTVPVQRTRTWTEQVPVIRQRTFLRPVTRDVQRQVVQNYQVCIPHQVQLQIPSRQCRMVPRAVTVPVGNCCPQCRSRLGLQDPPGATGADGMEAAPTVDPVSSGIPGGDPSTDSHSEASALENLRAPEAPARPAPGGTSPQPAGEDAPKLPGGPLPEPSGD